MPDILIRDVPEDVIGLLERQARLLGLSRTEYLRRMLVRESTVGRADASLEDWRAFAERHADLDDPDIMRQAWT
ncbi:MAG: antitoxin [Microthrixaceae bacterium]|nr:antitoxin [Microthrixaceae bacterium]